MEEKEKLVDDPVLLELATPSQIRLLEEALGIQKEEAKSAGALGFMSRVLAQVTLPHSRPKTNEFTRKNGDLTLTVMAPKEIGLPYGAIPRIQLAWLITETVKTREREIELGDSLSQFMKECGISPIYGKRGNVSQFRAQMNKLFGATFHCIYQGKTAERQGCSQRQLNVADESDIWFDPLNPEQVSMWGSRVRLSEKFHREVLESPVPIDLRAIKALKSSPMAMDIYIWLTHRFSYLRHSTVVPWDLLRLQLGADLADTRQGRAKFKELFEKHLKKVLVIYPEAKVFPDKNGLLLKPSPPHIPKSLVSLIES